MAKKVAIVTGAARGIGQAATMALAQRGFNLTLAARSSAQLDRVVQAVRPLGVKAVAASTDVSRSAEVLMIRSSSLISGNVKEICALTHSA